MMSAINPVTARKSAEVIADALDRMVREKPPLTNPLLSEWLAIVERHIEEAGWKLVRLSELSK